MVKTKKLAKIHTWWPNIGLEIENLVRSCDACNRNAPNAPETEISALPWPKDPWSRLHIDLAGPFLGKNFLIIVDSHSKWLCVRIVKSQDAKTVIRKLSSVFGIWGLPRSLTSDNGAAFVSSDYVKFCKDRGIRNSYISPRHPRSNGQAERAIGTVKNRLRKMTAGEKFKPILEEFLMHYYSTPHMLTNKTPAELFVGRRIRTVLDLVHDDTARTVEERQATMMEQGPKARREFFSG